MPATTKLAYTAFTNPDPLTVGTTGAVPSTVGITAAPARGPADISQITLTVPAGNTAEALARSPAAIKPEHPRGWKVTRGFRPGNKNLYDFTFAAGLDEPVTVTEPVNFVLHDVDVSEVTGPCTLFITEDSLGDEGQDETGTDELTVTKFGSDFSIKSFGPQDSVIAYDATTTLKWSVNGATEYEVTWYDGDGKRQSLKLPNTTEFWETPPLRSTTPVTLTAFAKSDSGDQLAYTMSTIVMVEFGDTRTGALSVRGAVDIIRTDPVRQDSHQVKLLRDKADSCTFSSDTDGLVHIQPVAGDTATGPLLYLRIPHADNPLKNEAQFQLPLHVPATIPLRARADLIAGIYGKTVKKVTFEYYWFPLGAGSELRRV